jgi:hypothetical protein
MQEEAGRVFPEVSLNRYTAAFSSLRLHSDGEVSSFSCEVCLHHTCTDGQLRMLLSTSGCPTFLLRIVTYQNNSSIRI